CLDGSKHVAVVQIAVLSQDAFVAGLIDVESKDLAPEPVLHNYAACGCRSRSPIRQIICVSDARPESNQANHTKQYREDGHDNLNSEHTLLFHTQLFCVTAGFPRRVL